MSIGPVMLNAAITRTQDFTTIKQNEDQKSFIDQSNFQDTMSKDLIKKQHQVNDADDANEQEFKYGDKEKGNGGYTSDQRNRKNKKNSESDGSKLPPISTSSFDITI